MITLAFAQMFYYLFVSLKQYGGDDGLSISLRSNLVGLDMSAPLTLYYSSFASVLAVVVWTQHMVRAPFGMVLQACRMNERRMSALGFHTLRYKLSAYVLSCVIAGVAGFLYAIPYRIRLTRLSGLDSIRRAHCDGVCWVAWAPYWARWWAR